MGGKDQSVKGAWDRVGEGQSVRGRGQREGEGQSVKGAGAEGERGERVCLSGGLRGRRRGSICEGGRGRFVSQYTWEMIL